MGKRSSARRLAMQALFQIDVREESNLDFILKITQENESFVPETIEFTKQLVDGVRQHLEPIDKIIQDKSVGWSLERITTVDRNILRSAIYEIQYLQTPPSIVINEAVNLAKKFSTAESSKFINGILGGLVENKTAGAQ